jgi:hypothetical protein
LPRGRLWLEFLPAYAPELNPVEYLWSHWKQHELPNFCPSTFAQLSVHTRRALKRMRRRPTLVMALWQQAHLFCKYIMRSSIAKSRSVKTEKAAPTTLYEWRGSTMKSAKR